MIDSKNVLVVAAHPDDEVLGVGGTIPLIKRNGGRVTVVIVTDGSSTQYPGDEGIHDRKRAELHEANRVLGTDEVIQWDFPDMRLDSVEHWQLNRAFEELIREKEFDTVFVQNGDDVNLDHRIIYSSVLVATRPVPTQSVEQLYAYYVSSSTEWGSRTQGTVFCPNVFVDIASTLEKKLDAMRAYSSELRDYPHPRSIEALRYRAHACGNEVGYRSGEAFKLIYRRSTCDPAARSKSGGASGVVARASHGTVVLASGENQQSLTNRMGGKLAVAEADAGLRVYLSPPHMSHHERELLLEAFDSNWIAPLGPHVDAFEREFAAKVGAAHAVAVSSGTAALHLALILRGVGPGDRVATSSLTFAASANTIRYVGATPVFIDSEWRSWNMDPELLAEELEAGVRNERPIKAVLAVDVLGQCADYDAIQKVCRFYDVPLIEDAAESLGASYKNRSAGTFGDIGCFSFNGNKIITTSGGGMLVTDHKEWADRARFLASQARDPAPHYEHSEVGYNYRMSNLLAAVGRGQLRVLDERVESRQANFAAYHRELGDLPGIAFMPELSGGESTRWLSCILVDPAEFGATREDIRLALEQQNIESRPVWKPMHLQPAHADCPVRGGAVSEKIFQDGLCLPSGSNLSEADRRRVVKVVRAVHRPGVRQAAAAEAKMT